MYYDYAIHPLAYVTAGLAIFGPVLITLLVMTLANMRQHSPNPTPAPAPQPPVVRNLPAVIKPPKKRLTGITITLHRDAA